MPNPEILLLAGPPGSGKSSIAKRVVELNQPEGVRHLSIGDLKRSIIAGETPSAYFDMLRLIAHPDRRTGSAPSEAITGIFEEFIVAKPDGLSIVDGFPRYMDRVAPFQESVQRVGANVLALCIVQVSHDGTLIDRMKGRAERTGQKIKNPFERLADHYENVMPTINVLSEIYPTHTLDGALPVDLTAGDIQYIYNKYTSQNLAEITT